MELRTIAAHALRAGHRVLLSDGRDPRSVRAVADDGGLKHRWPRSRGRWRSA
ncbi:hypothetical protein KGD83_13725 [Nocardiopsis akebiae]|uniref:Uncharacterized protein n=1 Tax=Nocardiopsis akebiae TaxID=2831968 RepID=A0ABX8CAI5_9ACTN|nr:hypothetical protein [Nocardiopsis akebiae]QUX31449.1 hypothetical protein KGD83_13725 [Nocardiopsis akebiae]